jgi:hypothetical protein
MIPGDVAFGAPGIALTTANAAKRSAAPAVHLRQAPVPMGTKAAIRVLGLEQYTGSYQRG